jgi:DivIVA domain-containing protein
VVTLISGDDPGLAPAEPDGRARALPNDRSLHEEDIKEVRFDVALRGYRMAQVDRVLRRTAYDLGYKDEMIAVLEAEVAALREGRHADAEVLRQAREDAASTEPPGPQPAEDTIELGDDSDDAPVADFERTPAGKSGSDAPPPADASEPREGSLLRRNPLPDTSMFDPAAPAAAEETALEVADRPAHA